MKLQLILLVTDRNTLERHSITLSGDFPENFPNRAEFAYSLEIAINNSITGSETVNRTRAHVDILD